LRSMAIFLSSKGFKGRRGASLECGCAGSFRRCQLDARPAAKVHARRADRHPGRSAQVVWP
jgi:hypothetical protein